jgi:peptidoglycan/LPS O-acetylase OafA/YrhL
VKGERLEWLDALRGIAVLAVVFEHLSFFLFDPFRSRILEVVHPGTFGVTLFFLVSGYIVPASLERGGDLRRFWVSRAFRLYPLWMVTVLLVLAVGLLGFGPRPDTRWSTLLANATMLQDPLGAPALLNVLWTLSYEMVFYLLISALFLVGRHRHSSWIALALTACALVGGGVIVLAAAAVLALVALPSTWRMAGGVLLGVLTVGLLAFNRHGSAWEGFAILATMFAGTTVYRAQHGQISRMLAFPVIGAVLAGVGLAAWRHGGVWFLEETPGAARIWWISVALAAAAFGGGLLWRARRFPRVLVWVGLVSYSVYLLHQGVAFAGLPLLLEAGQAQWWWAVAGAGIYLSVLIPVCCLSYRLVEQPGRRLGRRLWRDRIGDRPELQQGQDIAGLPVGGLRPDLTTLGGDSGR